MISIDNFPQVASQIESERGISRDILISAIETALISACKKRLSEEVVIHAFMNAETGDVKIYQIKTVVKTISSTNTEITLKDAKTIDPEAKMDSEVRIEITNPQFGRIAAQTAKQVITQRIREAEKTATFESFKDKEGQIITGTIQRIEGKNYLINLGQAETILYPKEQIPGEVFYQRDNIKIYVSKVEKDSKGTHINISRAHPDLLRKLVELEIPEVQDGIIEIISVSREPGTRSKVAVKTNNPSIGAVGTCVGQMGSRIQPITKELFYEKIDVLEWNEDPKIFISNALKPAQINQVIITSEEDRTAIVVVPTDQLSLAIGKQGVNVRLAVKLTGWKLDIISSEEYVRRADEISALTHVSIVDKIQRDSQLLREENDLAGGETSLPPD
ncbi:MAG: transcription termination/antitermination protein NusA [bacterium]|nr:transcription termination/antitermination protein NusA [bacterium]